MSSSKLWRSLGFRCRPWPWMATELLVALAAVVGLETLRWSSLLVGDDAWAAFLPKLEASQLMLTLT
jgi:hypothetical protein